MQELSARYASHRLDDTNPFAGNGVASAGDYFGGGQEYRPQDHRRKFSDGGWDYPPAPQTRERRPVSRSQTLPIMPRIPNQRTIEAPSDPYTAMVRHQTDFGPLNAIDWKPSKKEKARTKAQNARTRRRQMSTLDNFRRTRAWPPAGYSLNSHLDPREAEDVICAGASTFKGYTEQIPNAPPGHFRYYTAMQFESAFRTDRAATSENDAFQDISLTQSGEADTTFPWQSLEQPSMAYAFGKYPGTTTLTHFVGKGSDEVKTKFGTTEQPRRIRIKDIFQRLVVLQEMGLEEDEDDRYDYLYEYLLDDIDADRDPHLRLDQQITDLITVLTHQDWTNFNKPRNQVLAKFYDSKEMDVKQLFFHQLLLSCELYLRIHSHHHTPDIVENLLRSLPEKVAWDVAVAQRWMENMMIKKERVSGNSSRFVFILRSKDRQKESLCQFAKKLKWPNMDEVKYVLEERDRKEKPLEDRSADTASWFSGCILPGPTLPWLLMNSLIDCDRETGRELRYLSHLHPAAGFQYRANTYWSYDCVVGKVLGAARGVNQVAGWIGPCIYSPDLKRKESVLIRQTAPPGARMTAKDLETMADRTAPLGPADSSYPVEDYEVLLPDLDDSPDVIRLEKLGFRPVRDPEQIEAHQKHGTPLTFDADVTFAIKGESWPLELRYNVDYIAAMPCHQGPHVLFWDFAYRAIKVDDGLISLNDWAIQSRPSSFAPNSNPYLPMTNGSSSTVYSRSTASSHSRNGGHGHSHSDPLGIHSNSLAVAQNPYVAENMDHQAVERVLAIEALGVSDNEVFARAWCAHWGFNAIVANVRETCMACAIREAYAAQVCVVIFTEGGRVDEKD